MNKADMEKAVKQMVGDDRYDAIVPLYISLAQSAVVSRLFPMDDEASWDDVPDKFHARTCEIAVYLINKRGAEGEVSHKENGTQREYGSAAVPNAMFAGMVPFAHVPSRRE